MFDSPIVFCPHCRQYVALDQSVEECRRQYRCTLDPCPLAHLFPSRASSQDKEATDPPEPKES